MRQADIPARNKKIVQLAKDHNTADQIAEIMGMKRYRVLQILRAFKVKADRVSHDMESPNVQAILKEIKAGVKQSDIAKKFKVSRQYVSQIKFRNQALEKVKNKGEEL